MWRKLPLSSVRKVAEPKSTYVVKSLGLKVRPPIVRAEHSALLDRRGAEALHLIEIAASLYGTNTPRGKRMMRWADGLESQLERAYGLERP